MFLFGIMPGGFQTLEEGMIFFIFQTGIVNIVQQQQNQWIFADKILGGGEVFQRRGRQSINTSKQKSIGGNLVLR